MRFLLAACHYAFKTHNCKQNLWVLREVKSPRASSLPGRDRFLFIFLAQYCLTDIVQADINPSELLLQQMTRMRR
jgi:hypothetical protein